MAGELEPPDGSQDDQSRRREDENDRIARFYRGESSPYQELVERGGRKEVRHAVRVTCAEFEDLAILEGQRLDEYPIRYMIRSLYERQHATAFTFPLHLAKWPRRPVEGEDYEQNSTQRAELVAELEKSRKELTARKELVEKFQEQHIFKCPDVDLYLKDYFLRYGKNILPSQYYGIILRSKETYEGFVPFGEKVETAFNALRDIGEGEAKVRLQNGQERTFPNIFGLSPHRELYELAFKYCILPRLKQLRPQAQKTDELLAFEDFDDKAAAVVALELFRHFDYDIYYCFGRKDGKSFSDRVNFLAEEVKDFNLELGFGTGDLGKAMYLEARRWAEWGRGEKEGHRKFPRAAGNPMSLGCYPMLTLPMLEIVTTEILLDNVMQEAVKQAVAQDRSLKGKCFEMPQKVDISVHSRCFGTGIMTGVSTHPEGLKVQIKMYDDPEKKIELPKKEVVIPFMPIPLAQVLWDGATMFEDVKVTFRDGVAVKREASGYLGVALGPQTDAYEVPYKLQGFYSHAAMFSQFMRTDYAKQFAEVAEGDLLLKMNKNIEIALGMMAIAKGINPKTMEKLSIYIRCVFLGTLAASVEDNKRSELEKTARINEYAVKTSPGNTAQQTLMEAARIHSFLPLQDGFVKAEYKDFVNSIRSKRRAPLPGECKEFFSKEELEEISVLYPFGLR